MNTYKIIFIGTPDFAVPSLEKLLESNYNIITIITQPDKKVGRKQEIIYSPVKKVALKYNIPLLQPRKIRDIYQKIKKLNPDIIITAAYGQIIPKNILDIPKFGCINIHGSLLPKYRGASPIQYAILRGDKKTGVTIMEMNEKMDEGDIISQKEIKIENNDTASTLHDKLSKLGANLLLGTLPKIFKKEVKFVPQDRKKATYTRILKKEDGKIDWYKKAVAIERMIRAFYPWPGTYAIVNFQFLRPRRIHLWRTISNFQNKRLKVIQVKILSTKQNLKPGTLFQTLDKKLAVTCNKGSLILERIQLEGKKIMTGAEFLRGYSNIFISKFQ